MKKWVTGTLVFALAAFAVAASRPAEEQSKIDWLLDQIGGSGAIFIRNGQEYEAKKAVSHLKQKLWFAGRRVQTARDFIAGCATHSEQSGKTYEIRFADGKQRRLAEWLNERLAELEKGKAVPEKAAPKK